MNRLEGLAKIYQFNLSNAVKQLYKIEITYEMMKNIVETAFSKFEKEASLEELENAKLPNLTEYLYTNEIHPNIDNNKEDEFGENKLSEEDYEYDVNEIVASRLESMQL
ncbi:hypothetical protein RclHR1_07230007 [Rhizophagus clarus]|uniref:Uncharacterized protein n=1 Tax=Rhizophagus clarus TaxID=94130 RepID=A0A2Z6SBH6_9GLOM|nr:hypothetical protein RclHR1_07230007 [Rhizophagus clarus]GES85900.1 hypothetical protein RCL_jg26779.t1 [Rhizophagus clarus]